jgi:hypothetical protein
MPYHASNRRTAPLVRKFLQDGTLVCSDKPLLARLRRQKIPFVQTVIAYEPAEAGDAERYLPRDTGEELVQSGHPADIPRLIYMGRITLQQLGTDTLVDTSLFAPELTLEQIRTGMHWFRISCFQGDRYRTWPVSSENQWYQLFGCPHRQVILRIDAPQPIITVVSEFILPDLARMVVDFLLA